MLTHIFNLVNRLYNKKISAKGLAIFRIAFSLVLLCDVLYLFYFRHLIFDEVPYLIPAEVSIWPVFLFWIIAIIFIVLGLFTRIATIINYILTVIIIGTITSYEYHMFYTYLTINFLLVFLPISKAISMDRLMLKLKFSNTRFRYNPPETVSVLAYYCPLLMGIGFVYFDSVFFKFNSTLWLNGLGLWLPSSLPQNILFDITPILNLKYFVIALGYFTLLFETIFIFVFWRKRFRVPVFFIGLCFHIGIFICYPIPGFALGVSAIYLLMVPVSIWERLFKQSSSLAPKLKFYYDGECPLCNRTRIIVNHLDTCNKIEFLTVQSHYLNEPALKNVEIDQLLNDIHSVDRNGKVYVGLDTYIQVFRAIWYLIPISMIIRIPGVYHVGKKIYKFIATNRTTERCNEDNCGFEIPNLPNDDGKVKILTNFTIRDLKVTGICIGLSLLIFFQILVTYNSPLSKKSRQLLGVSELSLFKAIGKVSNLVGAGTKTLFGITYHGVFVDSHFNGYNHTIAVVYVTESGKELWLPIVDADGSPGNYQFGPVWAKWGFRVNSPLIDQKRLNEGIRDFTSFWAHKNSISLKNARFVIRVKKNIAPYKWEHNFLRKQLANPWLDGGEVTWKNQEFSSSIKTIEEL
jgi:predicted DCC family thiol-disulfide oxidoreductase YuxK